MCRLLGVVFLSVLTVSAARAQDRALTDVLARAGAYAAAYRQTTPLLAADEKADDVARAFGVQSSDTPGMEVAGQTDVRRIRASIVMVADDRGWQAYRDVLEVNTKVQHDKKDQLEALFAQGPPMAMDTVVALNTASRRWQVGSVPRVFNIPTFPLIFLLEANQARFTFVKKGEKKHEKEPVWVVSFQESRSPTMVVTPNGDEYPIHGELWIEPATGRLVKSRMIIENLAASPNASQSDAERYRPRITIDTAWAPDPALKIWVPVEMNELYVKATEQVTCKARYTNFRLIARARQ